MTLPQSSPLALIEQSAEVLYEEAPCGYIFTLPDGTLIKVNQTFADWMGRPKSALLAGTRFQQLLTVGSKIYYETHYAPLLRMQGALSEITIDLNGKDDRTVPVLINSAEMKDAQGTVIAVKHTLFHIGERRRYERELVRTRQKAELAEQRLRFLAHAGDVLRQHTSWERLLPELVSLATQEFCDACTVELSDGGNGKRAASSHRSPERSVPSVQIPSRFRAIPSPLLLEDLPIEPDPASLPEEMRWLFPLIQTLEPQSLITVPVLLEHSLKGFITFLRTELGRRFDSDDRGLAEEIAKRVAAALETGRLHAEKLREEKEKEATLLRLQEERDLREKFVATLTHDLRSPITAVKMSAELILRKTEQPESVQKHAVRVINNVNRADQMIRDLLDANRIRAGEKIILEMEECDLREVLQDAIMELTTIHGDRFQYSGPPSVRGFWNPKNVRRIIENLCNNAVKYGDPHATIEVGLRPLGNEVAMDVHNTGNPIPAEEIPTLFEPYRRAASAIQGGQKGWGLGLTLVRGVTEAHGGRIQVVSSAAHGTTFTVTLPLDSRPHGTTNPFQPIPFRALPK